MGHFIRALASSAKQYPKVEIAKLGKNVGEHRNSYEKA